MLSSVLKVRFKLANLLTISLLLEDYAILDSLICSELFETAKQGLDLDPKFNF